jgi:Protein of unknown function (DUF3073)
MGRGRAKAKQTKVARELKYNSPNMDLERLKADLGVSASPDDSEEDSFLGGEYDDDYDEDDAGRR